MKQSANKSVGLDVGCGEMLNYHLFKTNQYIGFDLDRERIETGKQKYPKAIGLTTSIEESNGVKGDFLLCIQVFNNRFFKKAGAVVAVTKLCSIVNSTGSLIFNYGKDVVEYEDEIDGVLKENFSEIKKIKYGAPFSNYQYPTVISFMLAILLLIFPPLRSFPRHDYVYYFCQNKK